MSMFQPAGPAPGPVRHHVANAGVTHPGSSVSGPSRSAFKVAKAALDANASSKPPRTVWLPPNAWATTYRDRPSTDVEVGLRLYSGAEATRSRAAAAQKAWQLHPQESDVDERCAAGDDVLMAWLVALCTCKPDDIARPFFGGELGAEDIVPLALTPKGIEFLFDALDQLLLEESPTVPEADDEGLLWLGEVLTEGDPFAGLTEIEARRARRLLAGAIELLRGGDEG
jgi:hypothetical protein